MKNRPRHADAYSEHRWRARWEPRDHLSYSLGDGADDLVQAALGGVQGYVRPSDLAHRQVEGPDRGLPLRDVHPDDRPEAGVDRNPDAGPATFRFVGACLNDQ